MKASCASHGARAVTSAEREFRFEKVFLFSLTVTLSYHSVRKGYVYKVSPVHVFFLFTMSLY